jgi:uncharacterized membrane protein
MHDLKRRAKVIEETIEITLGKLVSACLLISTSAVLLGGVLNLLRHGNEFVALEKFYVEPAALRALSGIADAAFAAQGRGIIQFGLILLLAVPGLRVATSMLVFIKRWDLVFSGFTLFVLLVLSFSLFIPWN